jgi:hypothetical protein
MKFQYSLRTLFIVVLLIAMGISQFTLMRQLREAKSEIAAVRREFGYIHIDQDNEKKILISQIDKDGHGSKTYRMHVPPGQHYMMNLYVGPLSKSGKMPEDANPTETISLNPWQNGADIALSIRVVDQQDGKGDRVIVKTDEGTMIDYQVNKSIPNWDGSRGYSGSSLDATDQKELSPTKPIQFYSLSDLKNDSRGIIVWLETVENYEARSDRIKAMQVASPEAVD